MKIGTRKIDGVTLPALLLTACVLSGCGGSGESHLDAGMAALREGNYNTAAKSLENAVDRIPNSASAHCNLGIAYWKQNRHKEAIACFRKAAQFSPEDVRPLEFLGNVYIDMQNWNEARNVLIQADKRMPSIPRILTTLALVEFHSLNNPQALARLTQALEVDPGYAPALYNMAILQRDRLKNKEAAIKYFQNYAKVAGNDSRIKDLTQFLNETSAPKPPVTPPPAPPAPPKVVKQIPADPLVASAKKAIEKQEFDSALEMLKQATRKNTPDPSALWELAILYDKHLKYDEKAAEAYRKFGKHYPNDSRATVALKRAGELQPVAKKPEVKPDAAPKDPEAGQKAFEEGCKFHDAQKWDEAIACYKHAIELDKSMSIAAYNIGLILCETKGDLNGAKDAFLQALAMDSEFLKARYMLAVVYTRSKQNKQAIEELNKIFRVAPDYAKAYQVMGTILSSENNIEGARVNYEKYIKLAPDDPSAKQVQQWLDENKNQPAGR